MASSPDLQGFETWLRRRQLRALTIKAYVASVKFAYKRGNPVKALSGAKSRGRHTQLRSALNQYARFSKNEAMLEDIRAVQRPRTKRKPARRPLDTQEWNELLRSVKIEEEPISQALVLIVHTGLRSSDVLNIERSYAEQGLENGILQLEQKGGDYRPFPVGGGMRTALRELVEYWEWERLRDIISDGQSDNAAYMVVYRKLKKAAERAGFEPGRVHPHLLRITAAIQLYTRTKDIWAVKEWLGHSDIATTQIYLSKYTNPDNLMDSMRALQEEREE